MCSSAYSVPFGQNFPLRVAKAMTVDVTTNSGHFMFIRWTDFPAAHFTLYVLLRLYAIICLVFDGSEH